VPKPLHILIPVFNDWDALESLVTDIDRTLASRGWRAEVQVVDDGGLPPNGFGSWNLTNVDRVDILRLRRNVGHQRAICIGLVNLYQRNVGGLIAVMDGDGQDRPEDLIRLVDACMEGGERQIVFAGRRKRSEGVLFQLLYQAFLFLHLVLVGFRARVGNFSVVPFPFLETLLVTPETWNHYAAAIFRTGLPRRIIPAARGHRTHGRSRMNLVSLVSHGLSAIAVFSDVVGTRMLLAIATVSLVLAAAGITAFALQLASDRPVPDRLILLAGLLVIIVFHATLLCFMLALFMLHSRSDLNFVPVRDTICYVSYNRTVFSRDA
jgi:polyisoprenyl-phosphate glycosyltransferase